MICKVDFPCALLTSSTVLLRLIQQLQHVRGRQTYYVRVGAILCTSKRRQ